LNAPTILTFLLVFLMPSTTLVPCKINTLAKTKMFVVNTRTKNFFRFFFLLALNNLQTRDEWRQGLCKAKINFYSTLECIKILNIHLFQKRFNLTRKKKMEYFLKKIQLMGSNEKFWVFFTRVSEQNVKRNLKECQIIVCMTIREFAFFICTLTWKRHGQKMLLQIYATTIFGFDIFSYLGKRKNKNLTVQ
jgi:hypothetical protein